MAEFIRQIVTTTGASAFGLIGLGLGVLILYCFCLCTYRVYFHPLAAVPGPKLAALTQWVEVYYECFKKHPGGRGGQFMFAYRHWHVKYGPIVRISPNEVHIQDAPFYETLYSQSRNQNKLEKYQHRFNNTHATFSTPWHSLHRHRRAAINPFFSKRRVALHAPHVQKHTNKLCDRLENEIKNSGQILNVNDMWGCYTSDVVVSYALERQYDFILRPEFIAEFPRAIIDLTDAVHYVTQFPWALSLLKLLPDDLVRKLQPSMGSVIDFNNLDADHGLQEMRAQISTILSSRNQTEGSVAQKSKTMDEEELENQTGGSMFTALLNSNLPPSELSLDRLHHEAISVIGAGLETTLRALTVATFHIANNPQVQERLRAELNDAIPDPSNPPSWEALQRLPYLQACIEEALRLSYGIAQRQPRTSSEPIVYESSDSTVRQVLPPGVLVGMDIYSISHDETLFPDSFSYKPERWLGDARAPDGKALSRYMVAFGHGTRGCVGMQLAYADLFIGLSSFFRRFEVELFETKPDAVECYFDMFVPRPSPGTKGVRVLLK
ncbi:MAG: hypothetical protein M1831_007511 [Alyxoria varia]|nr:MAG: hypothetical protein M1831_007511 [Alyxoria varia]